MVPAGLVPDDMAHDIVVLVLANRHVVERNVGNTHQMVVQLAADDTLFLFRRRQCGLQLGNLGLQLFRQFRILLRHGGADVLGGGVAARLHLLNLQDDGAAFFIERDQSLRQRLQAALGQRGVESFGIVTDPFDIEHRRSRSSDHFQPGEP